MTPNQSHGHVTPNADGYLARCGGPKICKVCLAELAQLRAKSAPAEPSQGGEAVEVVTYIDDGGPLQWRDRITEIDRTIEALEKKRVSLVQRLEDEGFRLVERINAGIADATQAHEDMSDWRNWKADDQVKVILANDCDGLRIGRVVIVRSIEQANYGGSMPVSVFYDGDWNFPEADDGSGRCVFEFHSRPSK